MFSELPVRVKLLQTLRSEFDVHESKSLTGKWSPPGSLRGEQAMAD